jgi:hypothetical protein
MIKKLLNFVKNSSKMYLAFNAGVILGLVIGSTVGTLTALAVTGVPDPASLERRLEQIKGHDLSGVERPSESNCESE